MIENRRAHSSPVAFTSHTHTSDYRKYLLDRGYASGYVESCEVAVRHFSVWMMRSDDRSADLCEALVADYLDALRRDCRRASMGRHDAARSALAHLLAALRATGAIAPAPLDATSVGEELRAFDRYMAEARGLAKSTRQNALRIVGRLLRKHFTGRRVEFDTITPEQVRAFFAEAGQALHGAREHQHGGGRAARLLSVAFDSGRPYLCTSGCGFVRTDLAAQVAASVALASRSRTTRRRARATGAEYASGQSHGTLCTRPGLAEGRGRAAEPRRHRLGSRHRHVAANEGTTRRRHAVANRHRQLPSLLICATRDPRRCTEWSSPATRLHTSGRYAPRSSGAPSAVRMRAPALRIRARTCFATRWPAACSPAAPRSRKWPTSCATVRSTPHVSTPSWTAVDS